MYYFVSDTHLRSGDRSEARRVERLFVEWLERVSHDAQIIFLCGDIFDFWFEYQQVVPKGFVRTLGKIAEITSRGVRVVYMVGNHDMWVGEYLKEECGVEIYTSPEIFVLGDKRVHVAHGDNLNVKGDWKLRLMNKIFRSKVIRVLFSWLVHPDIALKFGLWWSDTSRKTHVITEDYNTIGNIQVKFLVDYSASKQEITPSDLYVYGHLHQSLQHKGVDSKQREYMVTFIRDWSHNPTYAKLDAAGNMTIEKI